MEAVASILFCFYQKFTGLFVSDDGQGSVVVNGLGVTFVVEGVVIDTVGEFVSGETVAFVVDLLLSIAGVGLVILLLIDFLAPTVINGEDVRHQRVHVLDGKHVILAVTVRGDDVGEDEVGLDIDYVADGALTALVGSDGESDGVFAPRRVGMFSIDVVGVVTFAVIPCPVDGIACREHAGVGNVDECDGTAFTKIGAFRVRKEVGNGLGVNGEIVDHGL